MSLYISAILIKAFPVMGEESDDLDLKWTLTIPCIFLNDTLPFNLQNFGFDGVVF